MRVLLTASRTWDRQEPVWTVLDIIAKEAAAVGDPLMTVVHGCAKGGDEIADRWVRSADHPLPVTAERHPPNYRRYGKRAPWVRDTEMVVAGADICLAFIRECADPQCRKKRRGPHGSHGATGTADMAEAADIKTQRFEYVEAVTP
jgi:hypothetical protein